jgi:hypothetical protein
VGFTKENSFGKLKSFLKRKKLTSVSKYKRNNNKEKQKQFWVCWRLAFMGGGCQPSSVQGYGHQTDLMAIMMVIT